MLTRSVVFTTNGLKPNSLSQGMLVQELFETMVTLQIQKTITNRAYEHLFVAYNYDLQRPDLSAENIFNIQFTPEEEQEVRSIHHLVGVAVESLIEEFHLFVKDQPRLVLNFNSCLLNRFNFVLSVEVIPL
jgi:hypothetical protein